MTKSRYEHAHVRGQRGLGTAGSAVRVSSAFSEPAVVFAGVAGTGATFPSPTSHRAVAADV